MIRLHQREPIEHLIQSIAAFLFPLPGKIFPRLHQLDFSGTMTPIKLYTAFIQDFDDHKFTTQSATDPYCSSTRRFSCLSVGIYRIISIMPRHVTRKSLLNLDTFLQRADLLPTSVSATAPTLPDSINGIISVTTRTPGRINRIVFRDWGNRNWNRNRPLLCLDTMGLVKRFKKQRYRKKQN